MQTYRTNDLAKAAGLHTNTIRLYERIGFLSPAARAENGYRIFSERHLLQLNICRSIFRCQWLGRELRAASLQVIRAMAAWELAKQTALEKSTLTGMVERLEESGHAARKSDEEDKRKVLVHLTEESR